MATKSNLVCGIGINDADYPVYITVKVGGRQKNLWKCPIYLAWSEMLRRCYSDKFHAKRPTYAGCTTVPEWHFFSSFRSWALAQDYDGKQLDKDLLIPGNKVYGPDTCVFVPSSLNQFLTDHGSARGEWPIGVSWYARTGKFHAQCSDPFTGKRGSLGYFDTPNMAHEAWRARKHEHACRYAEQQADPRIAYALRQRYSGNG